MKKVCFLMTECDKKVLFRLTDGKAVKNVDESLPKLNAVFSLALVVKTVNSENREKKNSGIKRCRYGAKLCCLPVVCQLPACIISSYLLSCRLSATSCLMSSYLLTCSLPSACLLSAWCLTTACLLPAWCLSA